MYQNLVPISKRIKLQRKGKVTHGVWFTLLFFILGGISAYAQPEITIRFANPQYDCTTQEYCVDVEYQSNTPNQVIFGTNVRFFFEDPVLEFIGFTDFQGGYQAVDPDPPLTSSGAFGPAAFDFDGDGRYIQGAIQLVNTMATPIVVSTTDWTKLFSVCFRVTDPNAMLDNFCPSLIWDLNPDGPPSYTGPGGEGVVITVDDPNSSTALSVNEAVEQFNWAHDSGNNFPTTSFGSPQQTDCIAIRCIDLELTKSVSNATPQVGDQVVFSVRVDNTGADAATMVEVTDMLPSGFQFVSFTSSTGLYNSATGVWNIGSVAGGGFETLDITVEVLESGDYINLAEVSMANGEDPDSTPGNGADTDNDGNVGIDDDPLNDEDDGDDAVVMPRVSGELSVIKRVTSVSGSGGLNDVISYAIEVTNTGNVTVSNIEVTDPTATITSGSPIMSLAPGLSATVTATYVITQPDVDAGYVENTATATGDSPNGTDDVTDDSDAGTDGNTDPINDPEAVETPDGEGNRNGDSTDDPTVTSVDQTPGIAITKTGVYDTNSDEITYTYVVSNIGNVTLYDIDVAEELASFSGAGTLPTPVYLSGGVELGGDPNVLDLPVGSGVITFRATYDVAQVDIAVGSVTNQAKATSNDPDGNLVEDLSDDPNDPNDMDLEGDNEPDDPTVVEIPCITINAFVYLEGALISDSGPFEYFDVMRTELNENRILPGQSFTSFLTGQTVYSPSIAPYGSAPWNYLGNEQDGYDSNGSSANGSANYPSTVVDWVLVSLRPADDPAGDGGPICQASALLHEDGRIEFVESFACCEVDLNSSYYVVVEHRNHLIVMSHEPVSIVNKVINYDFRVQQSYIDDPFGFGNVFGQKSEVVNGQTIYMMYGGNGNQWPSGQADTDINFEDESFWSAQNNTFNLYLNQDYDLNGDVNFRDRTIWERNNNFSTSVPRN